MNEKSFVINWVNVHFIAPKAFIKFVATWYGRHYKLYSE